VAEARGVCRGRASDGEGDAPARTEPGARIEDPRQQIRADSAPVVARANHDYVGLHVGSEVDVRARFGVFSSAGRSDCQDLY